MQKITWLLILAAIHLPHLTEAQLSTAIDGAAIEGRIINKNNEPVEFATVMLNDAVDSMLVTGATTLVDGRFALHNLKAGSYTLHIRFVGYRSLKILNVVYTDAAINLGEITLEEDAELLSEVVVSGQRPLIEQDGEKLVLNVENSIIASGGPAIELLSRAPGVTIDQNDQISLNGKTGVTVMINGKITYLPAAELGAMLRSMNANSISSVEIISNPSARYDATGNAGIINIKMKKNAWEGFNGSAQIGTGYGRYGKALGGINLNYRNQKWNHFVNYNFNVNKSFTDVAMDRTSFPGDTPVYFTQRANRVQQLPAHTWQAGSEWQWNKANALTLSTSGSSNERTTNISTITSISAIPQGQPDSLFLIANGQRYVWQNSTGAIGYKHQFSKEGNELTVDVDYSQYDFQLNDDIRVIHRDENNMQKEDYQIVSDQPTSFNIYAVRADYIQPINSKTSFETGVKVSYVTTISDVTYQNNQSGEYKLDTERSNDFTYNERITAGYVNLKTSIAGVATQVGLRAENTEYKGVSQRENQTIERDYFKLFPNIGLSKNINENYRIGFSYSYRIDRPAYNDLYPFTFYLDPFSGQRGNPKLLPQFTHSLQLSQTLAKEYTINLGYSNTSQYMAFLILLNSDNVSGYATRVNFNQYDNYNLSFTAPIKVTPKWTANTNVTAFYNTYTTQFLNDVYSIDAFSGTANVTQILTLPWGLTGEITTSYRAPNVAGLFQSRAMWSVNLGLQKMLFQKRASLRVNMTDLFLTNRIRTTMEYPGLDLAFDNRFETRVVRVNFTFNFGKNTGKAAKRRNAQEEEQRRINTN